MEVKRWTSRNDANYNNHHAEVGGVEFFRFPFQPYYARVGRFSAVVSSWPTLANRKYHATIYKPDPQRPGATLPVRWNQDMDQDALFVWAVDHMKELDEEEKQQ